MPYRMIDLPKNTFPLEWKQPPEAWLYRERPSWKEYKKRDPENFHTDYIMLYDMQYVHPNDPLGFRCCTKCNLGFASTRWRDLHFNSYEHQCRRAEILGLPKPEDPLLCKACEYRAFSLRKMESHNKSYEHHKALAIEEGRPIPTDEKYCKICDKRFQSKQRLKRHLETALHKNNLAKQKDETIFHCKDCDQHCATKQTFQKHLLSTKHLLKTGEKVIEIFCKICDNQYKNRKQYLKHCRTPGHKKRAALEQKIKII